MEEGHTGIMPSNQPLVSVVCPTYNSARYLRETLGSVFSQTYGNWELVIADDGSSDETIEIVKTFCGHRQPVRIISLPHSGVPAVTRNAAAFAAQGEFLAFLDSDDSWCPAKLERQIQFFQASGEFEACHTGFILTGDPSDVVRYGKYWQWYHKLVTTWEEIFFYGIINTSTLMVRADVFRILGGYDEDPRLRRGEDMLLAIRLSLRHPIGFLDEVLGTLHLTPDSVTRSEPGNVVRQGLTLIEKLQSLGIPLSNRMIRNKISETYYARAIRNLYKYDGPFRLDFIRSLFYDSLNIKKIISCISCILPARVLRVWLSALLNIKNRISDKLKIKLI
jgi:glycosyltransferase involved in cell wall biosynthesis